MRFLSATLLFTLSHGFHLATSPRIASRLSAKRGKLGKALKEDESSTSISPDLAKWAATTTTTDDDSQSTTTTAKPKTSRRVKQSERQELEIEQQAKIDSLVIDFTTRLQDKKEVSELLEPLREIVSRSTSFRTLVASSKPVDYRLAWVGSDDAICQFGTGLHKVPLARLQEVFVRLEKSKVTVSEVIRILGPFPNVKNVLQGSSSVKNGNEWNIRYTSMIDGTGKEILSDEGGRDVTLTILSSSPSVIVASTTMKEEGVDPLSVQGSANLLVFVKEEELEEQLEVLRVA